MKKISVILGMIGIFVMLVIITQFVLSYFRYPKEKPFKNTKSFPIKWLISTDSKLIYDLTSTAKGEIIYATKRNGSIYIADASNGDILKEIKIPGNYDRVNVKYYSDKIYCLTDNGYLHCFNMSGNLLFSVFISKEGIYPADLMFDKNTIILVNYAQGNIASVNQDTGQLLRTLSVKSYITYANVYKNIFYYSLSGYSIYAMDINSFTTLWEYDEHIQHTHSKPNFSDGKVYLDDFNHMLIFDAANGKIIGEYDLNAIECYLDKDYIYCVNGMVIKKVRKDTGKVLWNKNAKTRNLFMEGNFIYYKDENFGKLVKVNKDTGSSLWETEWKGFTLSKITTSGLYDIVLRDDNALFILDKDQGVLLWKLAANHTIIGIENRNMATYQNLLITTKGESCINAYEIR